MGNTEKHLDLGAMQDAPDCLTCGVCCIPRDPEVDVYCHLLKRDKERLQGDPEVSAKIKGDHIVTRKDPVMGTCCTFLVGVPGEAVACEIHDKRPTSCRLFPAGEHQCHEARRRHGLE